MDKRLDRPSLPRLISISMGTRLLVDTGVQIFNPFLPVIAAGLQTDTITMGRLVGVRSLMGLFMPVLGGLADRMGYQRVIRLGLLLGAVGLLLIGLSRGIGMALAGMVLTGLGLSGVVPSLHAYLTQFLPVDRRARGMAMVEYSWALAGIVGLSLAGLLIAATGWRTPFLILGAGLLVARMVFGRLPATAPVDMGETLEPMPQDGQGMLRQWSRFFDLGPQASVTWSAILATGCYYFAMMHVIIAHGAWLHQEYGLGPAELGTVAFVIGWADLCGSGLVSWIGDRLGRRRSYLFGVLASILAFALLPWLNIGVIPAVLGLALIRFSFEYGIVSSIPLLSELVPQQRGKVLALSSAFGLTSATLAGFTGPWAYATYGIWGLGPVSAMATALSGLLIWRWVHDPVVPPMVEGSAR